jgi:hypothetical protein
MSEGDYVTISESGTSALVLGRGGRTGILYNTKRVSDAD